MYRICFQAAQAIADGEVLQEELLRDVPELQTLDRDLATEKWVKLLCEPFGGH